MLSQITRIVRKCRDVCRNHYGVYQVFQDLTLFRRQRFIRRRACQVIYDVRNRDFAGRNSIYQVLIVLYIRDDFGELVERLVIRIG